jgi:hypothetical protein
MAVAIGSRLARRINGPSATQWIKLPFARPALVAVSSERVLNLIVH